MLSKDLETLSAILGLAGKEVSVKQLAKKSALQLDEAEKWAVIRYAAGQQHMLPKRVPKVPAMPDWLFKH